MASPGIILIAACGFDIGRTRREMAALERRPGWQNLRAVKDQRLFPADGNPFFNRPGPRLVESLEILAEVIRPELISFGHKGNGFCPVAVQGGAG